MKVKRISDIIIGKDLPRYNDLWLDTSEGENKAILKYKGHTIVGGGNSSDSSNPTTGDVNKVWQVTPVQKGTKTGEIVIVPEQTLIEAQELEYNDKFVPGAQCVAVIDGVEYRGEVVEDSGDYVFFVGEYWGFEYLSNTETFQFYNNTSPFAEVTAKLSVIEETPIYDYNWAPGVKIPIPTAEDEGKILVVTKVTDESSVSTIVPEQEVPADDSTPLTDVDLKYFVPGNTVTATITVTLPDEPDVPEGGEIAAKGPKSANPNTLVVSGTIEQNPLNPDSVGVTFNEDEDGRFYIAKFPYSEPATPPIVDGPMSINTKSSTDAEYILVTNLCNLFNNSGGDEGDAGGVKGNSGLRGNTIPYATIKLEYGEPNYEYQLQENSGSGSGSDYKSSGSIVKDMIEQGSNFNWAKYAIDITSLPCFKPEVEWPDISENPDPSSAPTIESILADGYTTVKYPSSAGINDRFSLFVVKQTGDNPTVSVPSSGEPIFTDCEPVVICENSDELTSLTPVRTPTSGATSGTDDEVRVLLAPVEEVLGFYSLQATPLVASVMEQGKLYVGYMNRGVGPNPGPGGV